MEKEVSKAGLLFSFFFLFCNQILVQLINIYAVENVIAKIVSYTLSDFPVCERGAMQ